MPTSLILYLDSSQPPPPDFLGREAQAWFLRAVEAIDPRRSLKLHEGSGHKPYTVSDLFPLPPDLLKTAPAPYIVRFTALEEELESFLTNDFIQRLPDSVRLWDVYFQIRGFSFSSDESPWAGQCSYRWLAETAQEMSAEPARDALPLEFVSPTGFRSNGQDIADPFPALVFRGCFQKWNQFAPVDFKMHDHLPRFVEECVIARGSENFERQRIVFAHGKRGGAVGIKGYITYEILNREFAGAWAEDLPGWAAQARALAMYSFFCGVGHHATVGMGQTFPRLKMARQAAGRA